MKKVELKINYLNLFIIIVIAVFAYLFYSYDHFDLIAKDIQGSHVYDLQTVPIERADLTKKGNKVVFSFIPKRDDVSGVILYGIKHNYIYGEGQATVTFKINYFKNSGKEFNLSRQIPITRFRGLMYIIKFDPLGECEGQEVKVELIANQDLEYPIGFRVWNDDFIENQKNSTKPEVLYRVNIREEIIKTKNDLLAGGKYNYYFFGVIVAMLAALLLLLIIRVEDRN
jgi:hypothetical protein